jgi:diaminohydroxyphosphoribosylaminopyrimidine deaminase/5-amino-6-(5-phosphoribosylamino)uracil reductase
MTLDHVANMTRAIEEAERGRGKTGDNPWVGCAIVGASGEVIALGYTQGPGEDHAEIVALARARELGADLAKVTVYSTLEPCAFHGRTPACALVLVQARVERVVTGIRDPNPRVDGAGVRMLRGAGIDVIEEVCAESITKQLAPWIFEHHPHEPERRARSWGLLDTHERVERLRAYYGVDEASAFAMAERAEVTEIQG